VFRTRILKVWGCILTAIVVSLCMVLLATDDVYPAPQAQPKIIALTFDDGPDPANTPTILDILKRHKVKATFFVVGQEVNRYPHLVRRESRRRHMVGNHSYTHRDLTTLSEAEVRQELQDTNAAIRAAGAPRPNLFRPPYGNTNAAVEGVATSLRMTQTLWAVDGYRYEKLDPPAPPAELCNRVVSGVSPGAVVVLHDGGTVYTDDALDCIITRLKEQGYDFGKIYPSEQYNSLNHSYVKIR
jgi:peptidoglycan/xylan/chitin deacetylase (PgdA/CDA1 family)